MIFYSSVVLKVFPHCQTQNPVVQSAGPAFKRRPGLPFGSHNSKKLLKSALSVALVGLDARRMLDPLTAQICCRSGRTASWLLTENRYSLYCGRIWAIS